MQEVTSRHDDLDRRLAVYFGLAGFVTSGLLSLARGESFDGALLQGASALLLTGLAGWAFGAWLRALLQASAAEAEARERARKAAEEAAAENALGSRVDMGAKVLVLDTIGQSGGEIDGGLTGGPANIESARAA